MDPRHPEEAISRMEELMEQFNETMNALKVETVTNKLGELERKGSLTVQEICLVAPRLHEAMMSISRTRRSAIAHGLVSTMGEYDHADIVDSEKVEEAIEYLEKSTFEKPESESTEHYVAPNQAEVEIVEPKPRKKKSKKKAKK